MPRNRSELLHAHIERGLDQFPGVVEEYRHHKDDHHGVSELPPARRVRPLGVWRRSLNASYTPRMCGMALVGYETPSLAISYAVNVLSSSRRPPADGGRWRGG